jgi:hypothetical protein
MAIKTFTSGSVLTAADTNTYLANSGLVYVKSQTVGTGVSSVTVTSAFSADYDNYRIVWTGGTISSLALIFVYMGGASGSGYYGARTSTTVGGTFSGAGDNNTSLWNYVSAGTTTTSPMMFDLLQPFSSARTHVDSAYFEVNAGSSVFGRFTGFLDNNTSYTSFTIDPQGAVTMTGGTITVYGYRKA